MLDAISQDVRYALRSLRASPGFAAVAILSLALGIGANTAIFSLIDSVLLRTLPVQHPEQLVQLIVDKDEDEFTNPIWEAIRDRQDIFSGAFADAGRRYNLATGGEARMIDGDSVSGQFFETLGIHAVIGRTLTPGDDKRGCPGTAVLSHDFWQTEYSGRADVVGKQISLDGHSFEILGVAPAGFTGIAVGQRSAVFVPLCTQLILQGAYNSLDSRNAWWMRVFARPKAGLDISQVNARLGVLAPGVFEAAVPLNYNAQNKQRFLAQKLIVQPAATGVSGLRTQYRVALFILMGIVGVVLLIACANVANLLLARGAARQREIAIRMALGSGRGRLIRQLLTESLLLSILGAALGLVFAHWGTRLLVQLLSRSRFPVYLDLTLDLRVLGFAAAVAIATAVLFGLAPAWRGTRVDPQAAMKANARGVIEGGKFGLGKILVMAQVALSMLLVVGAGLMLSTFFKLSRLDPGFDRNHILIVNLDMRNANYPPERLPAIYDEILTKLRAIPGVASASAVDTTPISGSTWGGDYHVEGYSPSSHKDMNFLINRVTPGYFSTMSIPILAGRDFDAHDIASSTQVVIINQTAAKKYFGNANPLGKHLRRDDQGTPVGPFLEIVGIVADGKYVRLREEIRPTAFISQSQAEKLAPYVSYAIRSAGTPPKELVSAAKQAIGEVNRDVSLQFTTLALQLDESLTREKVLATLSGFFGGLALLLAVIGLYGVMSYNVARRRNEIGIRMALGAEQSRVLNMVLSEVAILVGIGLAIGLALSIGASRFIESFLYGLKANDPWTFCLAAAILAIVAAIAGYLPARRASKLDPMAALREE